MADNSNDDDNDSIALPWYDYQPGLETVPPDHVTHLRIGVQQAVAAAQNGTVPELIELPDDQDQFCNGHPNLQQVQVHVHTVEDIPYCSFYSCLTLLRVEFVATTGPSSVAAASNPPVQSRLVEIAFMDCRNLQSVIGMENVSCSVERIGSRAFCDCGKLTTLDFSHLTRLQYLGEKAFIDCKSLTVVDLSNSLLLETIRESTFFFCKALKILYLPPKLKRIQRGAFFGCSALVKIGIPAMVEFLGYQAFYDCSSLTTITFHSTSHLRRLMNHHQPDNIFGKQPFDECTSLHSLELPGPPIPRELWPLLLEQFLQDSNGILAQMGILGKQRITIAWNFVRANIANFYVDKKKPEYCRKRDINGN
eukprot:CAMPEP_0168736424 /NCGR_PEP_ID=MMETSP0724-20121128/9854_1 /TAXON_ID=265536 /ORGANISM="Amphiprora sp., Strain CCMP467" /LENGTH=363 /DNA_ID=CAMNT_0008783623 /DNA_START=296 /DNA_END=1387 /DNA_ORIENTATION=+